LARSNQTVVVFMGVGAADTIAARLVAAGRDPLTPAAVVENGARPNQITAFGALGTIADVIQNAGIQGPALLIIGEVVALAQRNSRAATQSGRGKPKLSALREMFS
jgi:uroporphyrin-III C-methyltransferase/precorrin-2 dehydrogenase/sirohydrochlorin ferrochelatase